MKTRHLLVSALVLLVASCGGEKPVDPVLAEAVVEVSPDVLDMPANGGSKVVQLKATRDWAATSSAWAGLDIDKGSASERYQTITVTVDENEGDARSCVITFSIGGMKADLTVNQAAAKFQLPGKGEGTLESPFNIARAQAIIADKSYTADPVYLKGIVSEITEISTKYGNATYYLSDDGKKDGQLLIYRGKGLGGEAFTSENALKPGDEILLKGVLILYGETNPTPEVSIGSEIVTLNGNGIGGGDDSSSHDVKAASAPFGWMELPATSVDDGMDFIAHHISAGGSVIRNFSYYWDYDNLVAPWVAYPLTGAYIASGSRDDAWGLEPLLERNQQPVLLKGFNASSPELDGTNCFYARGHQIPQADRRITATANAQTYYGTNMTPQINKDYNNPAAKADFNGGIWSNLESQVRDWARKDGTDTLYVVTGCDLHGAQYKVKDNDGKEMTVPVGYYKALLRYSASPTPHYIGFAVYLEHKPTTRANINAGDVMSIDALEEKLGLDFFANLPAAIGKDLAEAVEAENPVDNTFWGISK